MCECIRDNIISLCSHIRTNVNTDSFWYHPQPWNFNKIDTITDFRINTQRVEG